MTDVTALLLLSLISDALLRHFETDSILQYSTALFIQNQMKSAELWLLRKVISLITVPTSVFEVLFLFCISW